MSSQLIQTVMVLVQESFLFQVRIAVLKVMAERYRTSNPGARVQVVGYDARPLIRITPPPESGDRCMKVMNYIEAIRTLPTNFTKEQLSTIMSRVNPRLYKQLRSIFVILNEDLPKVNREARPAQRDSPADADPSSPLDLQPVPEPVNTRTGTKRTQASSGGPAKSSRSANR